MDPDYGPSTYGERIADVYDTWFTLPKDTEPAVEFLAGLAGKGPALELGIGTGRVALPLAARGIEVHGIDASEAMVAKLRAKEGGDGIPVTMGDFADVGVPGRYPLVYVVFNTLFALLTQEDQLRCFANVAPRLADGGAFVIQAFMPRRDDLHPRSPPGNPVRRRRQGRRGHGRARHGHTAGDRPACSAGGRQREHVPGEAAVRLRARDRLMARLAGMRLRERWAGWNKEPFGAASGQHISVYELDR